MARKTILLLMAALSLILTASHSHAGLGWTLAQFEQQYGKPVLNEEQIAGRIGYVFTGEDYIIATFFKTELQVALAAATETNKRIAGVFLDTLSNLAYKAIKKNGEFVLPGFGKLVKQKRKARIGFNPKTQQKIKIPAKTVVKFRVAKAAKDAILGVKK